MPAFPTRIPPRCPFRTLGLVLLLLATAGPADPMAFEPPAFYRYPSARLTLEVTRWEKPSFYYVNLGLPPEFYAPIEKVSELPTIYTVRGVEYGIRAGGWPLDRLFLQINLPYESVYAELGPSGSTPTSESKKAGDLELAGAVLLLGSRRTPFSFGLNGWLRFPTGTNPFDLEVPLMSSGKGAGSRSIGLNAAQKVGRFSFFQGLNYENTGSISLPRFYSRDMPAAFQWPDVLHAAARIEFQFFKRSFRSVAVFYDLRMRQSGDLKYGAEVLVLKDRVYYSSGGLFVKVDPELAVTGQYSYFPFEFDTSKGRPDFGGLLTITVSYTPW